MVLNRSKKIPPQIKQSHRFRGTIVLIFLCYFSIHAFSQEGPLYDLDVVPDAKLENLDIYLVIGQSNMAGRAEIRQEDQGPLDHVFLFTGNRDLPWVKANNPLNRYSTVRKVMSIQRLSPAYAFAKTMADAQPDKEIGLVVNAKGGTKIVQWMPGTELYESAIEQAHKAEEYGKIKGVIWHQGEGDCDSLRIPMYLGRLEILINAIREEFDDPKLPFVAGQLFENERRKPFNSMLLYLPKFIRHAGVARSEGTGVTDGTHFDAESATLLGQRFGQEIIKLQE